MTLGERGRPQSDPLGHLVRTNPCFGAAFWEGGSSFWVWAIFLFFPLFFAFVVVWGKVQDGPFVFGFLSLLLSRLCWLVLHQSGNFKDVIVVVVAAAVVVVVAGACFVAGVGAVGVVVIMVVMSACCRHLLIVFLILTSGPFSNLGVMWGGPRQKHISPYSTLCCFVLLLLLLLLLFSLVFLEVQGKVPPPNPPLFLFRGCLCPCILGTLDSLTLVVVMRVSL